MDGFLVSSLRSLNSDPILSGYRFGVAGSYARGEERPGSDIDIVVDKDMLTLMQLEYIKSRFDIDVDVIQLPLSWEEDERLDALTIELGLPINDESIYKMICKEVIWYG